MFATFSTATALSAAALTPATKISTEILTEPDRSAAESPSRSSCTVLPIAYSSNSATCSNQFKP